MDGYDRCTRKRRKTEEEKREATILRVNNIEKTMQKTQKRQQTA